jgi:uncharacterized protein (UPF0335 family)
MAADDDFGGVINRDALGGYVDRVCNLHDDRDAVTADIKEVYAEAKEAGFDTTILRTVVREQRTDSEARNSRYRLLDAYRAALGLYADTPLGQAAVEREADTAPRRRRSRKAAKQEIWEAEPVGSA